MNVEIWSDISCPWCYIGRRRFETALSQFAHRAQVEITWRSFQLDPDAPLEAKESVNEMLARKYRLAAAQVEEMQARVVALAAQEGLDFQMDRVRSGNTFDAHRLLHLAKAHGLQSELKERLQKAHFSDGELVSDPDTLARLAEETGLPPAEVRRVLADPSAYAEEVRQDVRKARLLGIQGVPFFVVNGKYGISGAQPSELILNTLERAWSE